MWLCSNGLRLYRFCPLACLSGLCWPHTTDLMEAGHRDQESGRRRSAGAELRGRCRSVVRIQPGNGRERRSCSVTVSTTWKAPSCRPLSTCMSLIERCRVDGRGSVVCVPPALNGLLPETAHDSPNDSPTVARADPSACRAGGRCADAILRAVPSGVSCPPGRRCRRRSPGSRADSLCSAGSARLLQASWRRKPLHRDFVARDARRRHHDRTEP